MFGASYQESELRPPYQVTKLPGTVKRTVYHYEAVGKPVIDSKGNSRQPRRRVMKEINEPAGYIVTFPQGHSIRVRDVEEMKAGVAAPVLQNFGFDKQPGLVNMLTGDIAIPNREKTVNHINMLNQLPLSYQQSANGAK